MQLADVLTTDRILLDLTASSKKTLLEKMAKVLAKADSETDHRQIFEGLCQRERLGSTGLGLGIAIPHCRISEQDEVAGAVIRLRKPIDFDAPDQQNVDLFFALAIPEKCTEAHLKLLADIAEFFKDTQKASSVREAASAEDVIALMSHGE